MRVILDTNVLLSAPISPYAPPDTIYNAWRAARFELVTSVVQLDELPTRKPLPETKSCPTGSPRRCDGEQYAARHRAGTTAKPAARCRDHRPE
jgi:hypothetical protein